MAGADISQLPDELDELVTGRAHGMMMHWLLRLVRQAQKAPEGSPVVELTHKLLNGDGDLMDLAA